MNARKLGFTLAPKAEHSAALGGCFDRTLPNRVRAVGITYRLADLGACKAVLTRNEVPFKEDELVVPRDAAEQL